ncbi:MAG: hypothetical protein ABI609_03190 [Acidobacteriota bacterium]
MNRTSIRLATTLPVALLLATLVTPAFAATSAPAEKPAAAVVKVEPKKVCMINNQFMDKDQIPVEVEGKTYYGCCAMCKERLAKDAEARKAVDPLSGKSVDKAKAVIGAHSDGTVLYFENEENLAKFAAQSTPHDNN